MCAPRILAVLLASTVALAAGCAAGLMPRATEERVLTTHATEGMGLEIRTENGSVSVVADPSRKDVQVKATLTATADTQEEAQARLREVKVNFYDREDGVLEISPEFPQGRWNNEGCSLAVLVPRARNVTVRTTNGSVQLTALKGKADVESSNGNVTVVGQDGDVRVRTSNGSIKVDKPFAGVDVVTSNGALELTSVRGSVNAKTSNGAVRLTAAAGFAGPFKLKSSNGSATLKLPLAMGGKIQADTSNGSVTVNGPEDVKVTGKKTHKTIVFPGEGPSSVVETSNGSVTVTIE